MPVYSVEYTIVLSDGPVGRGELLVRADSGVQADRKVRAWVHDNDPRAPGQIVRVAHREVQRSAEEARD